MGPLADDAEWMRCLKDAFESTFEPLTTLFATTIAFCEPSNPIGLWEKNLTNILIDIRRRYISTPENVKYLEADDEAQEYAMEEVQSVLEAIDERLSVEDFGLKRPQGNKPLLPQTNENHQKLVQKTQNEIEIAIKNLDDGQKAVFNSIFGEILPGVTTNYQFAPASDTEQSNSKKSRGFFLEAPGGTGKTFVLRTVQSFLEL